MLREEVRGCKRGPASLKPLIDALKPKLAAGNNTTEQWERRGTLMDSDHALNAAQNDFSHSDRPSQNGGRH
ncbi:hypothetical protein NDU88_004854 [Pleurodeles waltl]|uniref:Uncharacterized protein n=1 Tax=Pleurodeles waltl TaxID=8319 RepID=A0AAV7WA65_PLEWA|nr:hypothetical protein NDU88_004854 [Pleurodeles waltl]